MTMPTASSERRDGPTPAGGAYSVANFRDTEGNPCPKSEARQVEIIEYRPDGTEIQRTYGTISPR
jgi:hypothetical protein